MVNTSKNEQYFWNFLTSLIFIILLASSIYILSTKNKLPLKISFLDFMILGLAIFRLTHLLVHDLVADFIRDYFSKFSTGIGKTISNLLNCHWCTAIWMALFISFVFFYFAPYGWYFTLVIALAGLGIFFEIISDRLIK